MNNSEVIKEFDALIQLISRTFHSSGAAYLSGLDVTMQQFIVMKLIGEKERPRMTDLADDLGVTLGNMTTMVERLIKHGYILRQDDPEDRRIVRVHLTAEGKNLIRKADERKKKTMEMILSKLSREDRQSLFKIMEKLVQAINQEKGEK
jgi:DNA-binding MarR family transcriptional regulator